MTIYALSTGPGISGIAIIRVSGEDTKKVIELLTNTTIPEPRVATLGSGIVVFVNSSITFLVSSPETLIIAIPEIPGPVDRA